VREWGWVTVRVQEREPALVPERVLVRGQVLVRALALVLEPVLELGRHN
jgi:flagella basal body P-ring formation protein FlgA